MSSLRYKLETKLLDNVDYKIYNPLSIDWRKFRWSQGHYKHYISQEEIYKFYTVSLIYYGVMDYVDIILLLNNIPSEFDLYPGTEIWIPKIEELKQFILENQTNE